MSGFFRDFGVAGDPSFRTQIMAISQMGQNDDPPRVARVAICGHTYGMWPYVDQVPGLGVPFPLAGLLGGFRISRFPLAESRGFGLGGSGADSEARAEPQCGTWQTAGMVLKCLEADELHHAINIFNR